jgi:hypothetical protein
VDRKSFGSAVRNDETRERPINRTERHYAWEEIEHIRVKRQPAHSEEWQEFGDHKLGAASSLIEAIDRHDQSAAR